MSDVADENHAGAISEITALLMQVRAGDLADPPFHGYGDDPLTPIIDKLQALARAMAPKAGSSTQPAVHSRAELDYSVLQALVENIPSAVFLKDARDNFKVKLWNKAAERTFGIPREMILERAAHDLWPKDQADLYLAADTKVASAKLPVDIFEESSQSNGQGTILLHTRKLPLILSNESEPSYLLCISDDITAERNQSLARESERRKLVAAERLFRAVVDNAPIMIFAKDLKNGGKYSVVNPAALKFLGLPIEGFIGKVNYDIMPPALAEAQAKIDREVIETRSVRVVAAEDLKAANGQMRKATTWKVPTFDENGLPDLLIGLSMDVTDELKFKADLELERAKSLRNAKLASLGEMSAGIAHEVNNPLAIIAGAVRSLPRFLHDEAQLKIRLEVIERASARIGKIVKSLQKFSRSDDKKPYEEHSLSAIIREAVTLTGAKSHRHSVPVTFACYCEGRVLCDEIEIEQVLVNLINNSIDAIETQAEKWVKIELVDEEGVTIMRVRDAGAGISAAVQQKLFQPFFTTKSVGRGTGLGLSIAKGILEEHGATIEVVEGCPNTCFEVRFPRAVVKRDAT